ncbi:hypothetical protein C0992_010715 [Termitomyces sp. T32_za158]|nr:hypothetical protein C0992_010715 [Termitomyces sp. T32_za158]
MVVSGPASSGRQQLAAKIVAGKADMWRAAMEAEAEQKAARRTAAEQEGGDKGETGTGDGAVAGTGVSSDVGADAPGAGICLGSLAIISTQSEGAGPSSPKHCQAGGALSLAPSVGKGKAPVLGVVRSKVLKQTTFSDDELYEAKGKTMVAPMQRHVYKTLKGACNRCWADNNPEGCWFLAGILPCLHCDSLKKPCTYDGLKSWERGKADKAIKRTFQKAILVQWARDFVEVQRVVKAAGGMPVISSLSLALPTGQGRESSKDKGKGKAVAKDGNGEKMKKQERPLTGD